MSLFLCFRQGHQDWNAVVEIRLTTASTSYFKQSFSLISQSSWDYRHGPSCSAIIHTYIFIEIGWPNILPCRQSRTIELKKPADLASPNTGIIGLSHLIWPTFSFFFLFSSFFFFSKHTFKTLTYCLVPISIA